MSRERRSEEFCKDRGANDVPGVLASFPACARSYGYAADALLGYRYGSGTSYDRRAHAELVAHSAGGDGRLWLRLAEPFADRAQSTGDLWSSILVADQRFPHVGALGN